VRTATLSTGLAGAFLLAVILWTAQAASGPIQWMDNGAYVVRAVGDDLFARELGALSHPLFHLVSVLVTRAGGVEALALLNAALMVPMALLVIVTCRALGAGTNASILAACTAVVAHSVFWTATKVEVYALNVTLLLACFWVAFDETLKLNRAARMIAVGALTGLALSVHQLTLVCLPPLYVYLLVRYRTAALFTVVGFLIGLAACYPAIWSVIHVGGDVFQVVRGFLTGADPGAAQLSGYESSLFRFDLMWEDKAYVMIGLLSFAGVQAWGLLQRPKNAKELVMWAAVILDALFSLSYRVNDRFTFLLPGAVLLSVLAWVRIDRGMRDTPLRLAGAIPLIVAPPLAFVLLYLASARGLVSLPQHVNALPFRNDVHYFLAPYVKDDSAARFAAAYARVAPPGATVFADWTPEGALQSAQAGGGFRGRTVIECSRYPQWRRHPSAPVIYVVRLQPDCGAAGISNAVRLPLGYAAPAVGAAP